MTAILEQLQGLVAAAEIPAGTLGVALILGLFGLMVVGLVLGQELAFVLGGAGVIVGWLAWGTPGVTIAMTKIYDQMQSYSMVAIPMFVLMANFLTHSKVADGLFESIRYLLGPLKGGLGLAVILVSTVFAATTGIVGASVVTMGMLSLPVLLRSGYKPSLACGMVCAGGSLGILIPPSIMLVSMGSYAEVSVGKIFFAAIVPGLSLSLGSFNLLPVYPLDGGRAFLLILSGFLPPASAERVVWCSSLALASLVLAAGTALLRQGGSPALLLMGGWLLIGLARPEEKRKISW